jgi:transcriptional regulator of arginine metabolism
VKSRRQQYILDIIQNGTVETQEQLLAALQERGIKSTQATISRDIKELHLMKEPTGSGTYRYTVSARKASLNIAGRMRTILKESVISIDSAQNIVVIRTMPGLANGACAALDSMDLPDLVGSLAGDDTAILIMRDNGAAVNLCRGMKQMLQ